MKRRDSIDPAWRRVSRSMGIATQRLGMMHLRKTSASILAEHAHYKYYASHFLSHSPKGMTDRHYDYPRSRFEAGLALLREAGISDVGPFTNAALYYVEASGLSARRFAELVTWRDERTVRRWSAGDPIPATARERLVWFLGISDAKRRRLVEIVTSGAREVER